MRHYRLRFAVKLLLVGMGVMGVGCGGSPAHRAEMPKRDGGEIGLPDATGILEIARQTVATNDTWVERAEFGTPERVESGWRVVVWRLPKTPGGHRLILLDETGKVTKYLRGS